MNAGPDREDAGAAGVAVRPVVPSDFPVIAELFGQNGACGGCWCMTWRVPSLGAYWAANKGENNRNAFRDLVESGKAHGCLAFDGARPVGWCSIGPKADFDYLRRSRTIPFDSGDGAWALTCFYIARDWQRRGLSSRLIAAACDHARALGAAYLDGYPTIPGKPGDLAPAFIHTGLPQPFEDAGFTPVAEAGARRVYRKALR